MKTNHFSKNDIQKTTDGRVVHGIGLYKSFVNGIRPDG